MTAASWIGIVIAVAAGVVGVLYAAGVFRRH
jgi:hypothetical protein